jgi:NodT family efflux transporter outer membrane factor (OMF) lipoprotein
MQIHSGKRPWFQRVVSIVSSCVTAVTALMQCGCTTTLSDYVRNGFKVGPNYQRPPVPVISDWIDNKDPRVREGDPNLASWWDEFDDPILTDLIHRSFSNNLTVRAAAFQILAAREQRAIALGELFPQTQAASLQYLRIQASANGAASGVGGAAGASLAPGAVLSPIGTGTTGSNGFNPTVGSGVGGGGGVGGGANRFFSNWATSMNLSWEVDFWGLFRRNLEAADASLDQSVFNRDEIVVMLLANVASFYVEIRTLQKRLDLARKNVAETEPYVKLLAQRVKAGTNPLPDYYQLKASLENNKALIPQLEITLRQTNNTLCTVLGIPVRDLLPELGDGTVPDAANPGTRVVRIPRAKSDAVVVGIPANLLLRRPDVMAAEQQLRIQSAQIGIAEAEMYPHIGINGSIGLAASDFNKLFHTQSGTGSIGPSLSWNILNYGRLLANVRFQNHQYRQFVANYQNTLLTANQEAENAMVGFLKSQEQYNHLQESTDKARDSVRYYAKQYKTGSLPPGVKDSGAFYNQLFTLNNFLVTQQDAAAQAEGNIALNLILLYKALGGGWQIRSSTDGVTGSHCAIAADTAPPTRAQFGTPVGQEQTSLPLNTDILAIPPTK